MYEDMHARLSVVESTVDRLDVEIKEIRDRCTSLEVCAAALPAIKETLAKIDEKLDTTIADQGQHVAVLVEADLPKRVGKLENWRYYIAALLMLIVFLVTGRYVLGPTVWPI